MSLASVVIAVRNDAPGLSRCLRAMRNQTRSVEVIVVDDGSCDGSGALARRWGARVIETEGNGAAAARNLGIAAANGEFVLFTDADCVPVSTWAEALLDAFAPGVVATKGTYVTEQRSVTARFIQLEYEERYRRMASLESIDFLDTYSLAVRRSALLEIGGFDEGFRSPPGASRQFIRCSDQEMSFRLAACGHFVFVPEAVVGHRHADGPASYARKKFGIGVGKAMLLQRHPRRLRGDSHTPDGLRYQVFALLVATALLPLGLFSPLALIPSLALALSPWYLSTSLIRDAAACHGLGLGACSLLLLLIRAGSLTAGFVHGWAFPVTWLGAEVESSLAKLRAADARRPSPERDVSVETTVRSG